ncbi:MAG: hypothetical protein WCT27_03155 [Patescibacteria group bacterium]|jgi:predicted Rossmann-fold nucleotide-binding protein
MPEKLAGIYEEKKRRVLGELLKSGEIKNSSAWLAIHSSSKEHLLTYESRGLVVAVSGSGSLPPEHPQSHEAAMLASMIVSQGGVLLHGGRSTGIMHAVAQAVPKKSIGIVFPELEKEMDPEVIAVTVNAPQSRVELLATCAPIMVLFRGGLGTLMVLMRAIVHLRNRAYHPEQFPQLVFVHNYWIGLLTTMMNMGSLPREFLSELKFFDRADQVISQIPKI